MIYTFLDIMVMAFGMATTWAMAIIMAIIITVIMVNTVMQIQLKVITKMRYNLNYMNIR